MHIFRSIKDDAIRYPGRFWLSAGFWVTFSYRFRRYRKMQSCALMQLILFPVDLFFELIRFSFSSMRIPSSVEVGAGLYLPHPEGIFINDKVKIGCSVAIFQQVTLGEWRGKAPHIKNGASIYAGAKVFGNVVVGEGAQVGANAVVEKDIPDHHVVAIARSAVTFFKHN